MKLTPSCTFLSKKAYFLLLTLLVAIATACGGSEDEPDYPGGAGNPDEDENLEFGLVSPSVLPGDWVVEYIKTEDKRIDLNIPVTIYPFEIACTGHVSSNGGYDMWMETYEKLYHTDWYDTDDRDRSGIIYYIKDSDKPLSSAMVYTFILTLQHPQYQIGTCMVNMLDMYYKNNVLTAKSGMVTEGYTPEPGDITNFTTNIYEGEVVMKKLR